MSAGEGKVLAGCGRDSCHGDGFSGNQVEAPECHPDFLCWACWQCFACTALDLLSGSG